MARTRATCMLLLGLVGCEREVSTTTDVSVRVEALVGGSVDTADPAVVVLEMITGRAGSGCTASFIDRTALLTAAHCLTDERGQVPAGTKYRVFRGADLNAATDADWIEAPAKNAHTHPRYNPMTTVNDVGVLVLDQPVDVVPLAINTKALEQDMIGAQVRLVGFGATSGTTGAGFGVKRTLTTTIQMLQPEVVLIGTTGHQACDGDSGGPALLKIEGVETIVGTDDYNADGLNCTNGDYYQRVDRQLDFITPFLVTKLPTDAGTTNPVQAPDAAVTPVVGGAGAIAPPGGAVNPPVDASIASLPDAGVASDAGVVSPPAVGTPGVQPGVGAMVAGSGAFAGGAAAPPQLVQYEGGCSVAPRRAPSHSVALLASALLFAVGLRRRRSGLLRAR